MKRFLLLLFFIISSHITFAQDIFFEDVLKANRDKLYRNLIKNSINNNLSTPLSDSTEEKWEDAFAAMEFLGYKSPWANNKIKTAIDSIQNRTASFQRAMLELIYHSYPAVYTKQVKDLLEQTSDTKIFAMCAVYLQKNNKDSIQTKYLTDAATARYNNDPDDPFLHELLYQLNPPGERKSLPLDEFFDRKYLSGNTLLISFQRQNRDYPGLAMVRDANGNFIKDDDGNYFAIPQLARSISNLPGYLTNGNTPEGVFRMDGFDHSKSSFIGPTTNIQLTLPYEFKASHFFKDNTLSDTSWDIHRYKKLLPANFRDHFPLMQTYYAGKAGRTEIIAHGTTVFPGYYQSTAFYPLTPTQGCLCTKEIWSEATGMLMESDQQKLSNAIARAGGPYGYALVINIDDRQEPVTINDIIPFLKLAQQK